MLIVTYKWILSIYFLMKIIGKIEDAINESKNIQKPELKFLA
jgi:hypothetical protein